MGRPAWFLHAPYPQDSYSTVGNLVEEQQDKVDKAKALLQRVRERQWNKKKKHRVPASYQEGDMGAAVPQSATRLASLHER